MTRVFLKTIVEYTILLYNTCLYTRVYNLASTITIENPFGAIASDEAGWVR